LDNNYLDNKHKWTIKAQSKNFRRNGRQNIMDLLKNDSGLPVPNTKVIDWNVDEFQIKFDHSIIEREIGSIVENERKELEKGWKKRFDRSVPFDRNFSSIAFNIHSEISKICKSKEFFTQHGLYFANVDWYWNWIEIGIRDSTKLETQLLSGVKLYTGKFLKSSQYMVLDVFKKNFEKLRLNIAVPDSEITSAVFENPFVVTKRVKSLWKKINIAIMQNSPILITGSEGCGKSLAVTAYSEIFCSKLEKVCLTPESEPSLLVGQLIPNDKLKSESERIVWQDGVITESIKNSSWVLLDNINQAESAVLERLNPVLEDPPIWNISENGDTDSIGISNGFRIFATMSVSVNKSSSFQSYGELTPAFYNRFTMIHYDDIPLNNEKDFREEIDELTDKLISGINNEEKEKISTLLWFHVKKYQNIATAVTFRNFVRFINCFAVLKEKHTKKSFASILMTNYKIVFVTQIKDLTSPEKLKLETEILNLLKIKQPEIISFLPEFKKNEEHVFTGSRLHIAEALMAAVNCELPILLEGPAAVGKTSMVSLLCKMRDKDSKLERVNNTNTTTIQDYFGSYLPTGDSKSPFVFKNGALTRAMENGNWFLSDEFNLAEAAVLNALFPLLEGQRKIKIPGSDKTVIAHPNFRFFATQNEAKYVGRNQLPISLRNRFLEIQFNDFEERELKEIILNRKKGQINAVIDVKTAENVSKFL
jgi:midasin (ATPase involved in ribosome maturation)